MRRNDQTSITERPDYNIMYILNHNNNRCFPCTNFRSTFPLWSHPTHVTVSQYIVTQVSMGAPECVCGPHDSLSVLPWACCFASWPLKRHAGIVAIPARAPVECVHAAMNAQHSRWAHRRRPGTRPAEQMSRVYVLKSSSCTIYPTHTIHLSIQWCFRFIYPCTSM